MQISRFVLKRFFWSACLICAYSAPSSAQHVPAIDSIVREGKILYRLEMANWHGSEIFRKNLSGSAAMGGYFSYPDGETVVNVIYAVGKQPTVLARITFDRTFNKATAGIDTSLHTFTQKEQKLFHLREAASRIANTDTAIHLYANSKLNLIPLADTINRVYIITAPATEGVVLLGNDYLLDFDNNFKLTRKITLHARLLPFVYKDGDEVAMHNHDAAEDPYITATDICTLMLYEKFTPWRQHVVVSDKWASVWDCGAEELIVLPREKWNEIIELRRADTSRNN